MRNRNVAIALAFTATFALTLTWPAPAQEFSWDHVPLYAEIGKTEGDFTPAEVKFLASHFDIVTVEKAHALRQRGSSEAGNKAAVAQLKAANPKLRVLVYWNAYVDYDRMYDALQKPLPDGWFVPEGMGVQIEGGWRGFDTSNADFRRWWIDAATALVKNSGADGVFVDGIPKIAGYPTHFPSAKAQAMSDGVQDMLKQLRARLGDHAIIVFNGLRSIPDGWSDGGIRFLRNASGAFVEDFATVRNASKEQIVADMGLIKQAEAAGKIVIVKGWPTTERMGPRNPVDPRTISAEADRNLTFPLACFLIVASDRAYFSYSWGIPVGRWLVPDV